MYFYIQNVGTGMVVDVKHNGKGELITYAFHGGANQLFYYDTVTEMIHSKTNGNVLDVVAKDSRVILDNAHGGLNQRWTFEGDSTIRNRLDLTLLTSIYSWSHLLQTAGINSYTQYIQNISTGLGLDIKNKSRDIIMYPYHGGPNQLFRYDESTQMIYSKMNGQVLDVVAKDNRVIIDPPHGGLNQRWLFDNDFTVKNHLGKVLDVATRKNLFGSTSTEVITYVKHGGSNQLFRRIYV